MVGIAITGVTVIATITVSKISFFHSHSFEKGFLLFVHISFSYVSLSESPLRVVRRDGDSPARLRYIEGNIRPSAC